MRHVEQYRERARVLYVRQTHTGCADFERLGLDLFGAIYGRSLRFNDQEGIFRFPNGGTLEVNQLEGPGGYAKYQGRSFTLLLIDEAGQYAVPDLLDRLRSNLRGPAGLPLRTVLAANPADAGHAWLSKRYVFKAAPWSLFTDVASARPFVYAPSTYKDNIHLDQDAYRRQLEAACPGDPELLRAWVEGDWAIARCLLRRLPRRITQRDRSMVADPRRLGDLPCARLRRRGTLGHLPRRQEPRRTRAG